MTTKKVILLAETNYLLDVVLERHGDCAYLFERAANKEIMLAIPECAFCEATAKLRLISAHRSSLPSFFWALPLSAVSDRNPR